MKLIKKEEKKKMTCTILGHNFIMSHRNLTQVEGFIKKTYVCYVCQRCQRIEGVVAHEQEIK